LLVATDGRREEIAIEPGSATHLWKCLILMCRLEEIHLR
jgi:hypothetical protein